jgi:hypothetical protein
MSEILYDFSNVPDYHWADLYYLNYELGLELDAVSASVLFHENLIAQKRTELQKAILSDDYLQNSTDPEDVKGQYEGQYYGSQQESIDELEVVFRNSDIMAIFAIFESKFKQLCEMIEDETKSFLKHTDLRAQGDIDRFAKYLKAVFRAKITDESKLQEILKYKIVRNKVAHEYGKLSANEVKKIENINGIKILGPEGFQRLVIVTYGFFPPLITMMRDFFKQLLDDVDERMKEIKSQAKT